MSKQRREGLGFRAIGVWGAVATSIALCACGGVEPLGTSSAEVVAPGYAAWKRRVPRERGTGAYLVDADRAIARESELASYYAREVSGAASPELVVNEIDGHDDVWSSAAAQALTYCVSAGFGADHDRVVRAMAAATASWGAAARVRFEHVATADARCDGGNRDVVFDVGPVSRAPYLARSFFPHDRRGNRRLRIASSALRVRPPLTLEGILRHELGHVLGLRHEHTRPEAGACYEDAHWRPLTPYDRASVMHYPQCNGTGDWDLTLSVWDRDGVVRLYGEPR